MSARPFVTLDGRPSINAPASRADDVESHRETTSSRYPGRKFRGVIRHARSPLVRCDDCGGFVFDRYYTPGRHAVHYRDGGPGVGLRLVNCVGAEVTP